MVRLTFLALTVFTGLVTHFAIATPPFQLPDHDDIVDMEELGVEGYRSNPSRDAEAEYRLPETFIPISYYVTLIPVLGEPILSYPKYSIPGFMTMNLNCMNTTTVLKMHAKNIVIPDLGNIRIQKDRLQYVRVKSYDMNKETDILSIYLDNDLEFQAGSLYRVEMEFVSQMSTDPDVLSGMYLSYYYDPVTGQRKELATTQFQSTHARAVFPCLDEPKYKASFEFALAVPDTMHALSNTERISSNPFYGFNGYNLETFAPTPVMSPYLIAIVISDFVEEVADPSSFRVPLKIWGPAPYMNVDGGKWAASAVSKLVPYYENFTSVPYEISKLDSAAIPQFSAGAMENWGLNTYRTEYLLHIPGESTEANRKKITQVLAHEVTHQWYGNLITCDWWAEAWLNEGFARFLQYRGMNHAAPDLVDTMAIISDAVHLAMTFDHGPSTHPVIKSVVTQQDASDIFNRISYEKAASLLRTIESFLSRDVFDQGIRVYLNTSAYGTVKPQDLWNSFQSVGESKLPPGLTVEEIMQPWTTLSGYPLVRVLSAGPGEIYVSQERFSLNTGSVPQNNINQGSTWNVPISVITAASPSVGDRSPSLWLFANETLKRYAVDTTNWIVLNADMAGYYRVLYDSALFNLIHQQLLTDHKVFSPGTRSQLLEDYFQFAEARYVPIQSPLDLTSYMGKETELGVWTPVVPHLKNYIRRLSDNPTALQALKDYLLPILNEVFETIGWNNQTIDEKGAHVIVRAQLFDIAVALDDTPRMDYAEALFQTWMQNTTNRTVIPTDLRPMVYCAGMKNADQATWDRMLALYRAEYYFWTKSQLLQALACPSNETVLENYISLAKDTANPYGFTLTGTLRAIAENSDGRPLVYNYVRDLVASAATESNGRIFANVFTTLSNYWHDQEKLNEIMQFVDTYPEAFESSAGVIGAATASLNSNIQWMTDIGSRMVAWLQSRR